MLETFALIYVFLFIIIFICLSLNVKIEDFATIKDTTIDIKNRLIALKNENKKYAAPEFIINDILNSLNCKFFYDFKVVNIESEGEKVSVLLYDKKNAFVANINYTAILQSEVVDKKNIYFFKIDKIELENSEFDNEKRFYNPEKQFAQFR